MPTPTALKREICEIGRRMWEQGFCAGNDGNMSCRLSKDRVLATPTGISKGFLTPAMMTVVDSEGRQIGRASKYKRTSEIFLHLALYQKRSDIQAIVHAHAPHSTAFALSGVPLPQGIYPEAEVCLGTVPTIPYSKAGYKELGQTVVPHVLPETNAILLGNHGAVTFGKSLMDAYYKLEMLETYCRILLLLKQIGCVNLLKPAEMAELLAEKKRMGLGEGRAGAALEQRFFKRMTE